MSKRLQELLNRLTPAERAGEVLEIQVPDGTRVPGRAPEQILSEVRATLTTKAIGEALIQARKQAGLKAKDMAGALEISPPRVTQIESSGVNLTLATVLEHANASGCEVEIVLRPRDPKLPLITASLATLKKSSRRTQATRGTGRKKILVSHSS
jgi:transcriptional regulator with XRE-family HTH domain